MIFENMLLNENVCFDFLYNFYVKLFIYFKKNWAKYGHNCVLVFK
jgi:hypothetical protein